MLSSLTNRIFLACTLLAMLSLGFAFYYINARATTEAEAELRRGLNEASTLVDQNRVNLTETFTRLTRLIADLPKLKAAVETGDAPTVQPLADEYRQELAADVLVLAGPRGTVLGAAGADPSALLALLPRQPSSEELALFSRHPKGLLQIVSVPVQLAGEPPEILGRLTVGFFLDDTLAAQFKRLTGSEIAFGVDGRILASTLAPELRDRLRPMMQSRDVASVTLGTEEFLGVSHPLLPTPRAEADADTPMALVLRSRTERLRFLNTIRTGLAGVLVLTLVLATIVSYGVARTVTKPLSAVTGAMREVAATGDLTRKVSLHSGPWDDEDARLLASAFNTLTDSIARFQAEAAHKDRLSSLGRLSTVIAHEIRNPLMIITTSLGTLRQDDVSAAERREAVTDIADETRRLNRIVAEVLDFAKPITFELAEASINDVCRDSAAAAWAGEANCGAHLDLDAALPAAVTDAERLRTALVNILANARNAVHAAESADMQARGGSRAAAVTEPAVRVTTKRDGDRVRLSIQDRGIGITPEDLVHIFDPYFTTRRAGTGLGLPIAKNIIEGLGGHLEVTSRHGEGTEIRIDLPLTAREAHA